MRQRTEPLVRFPARDFRNSVVFRPPASAVVPDLRRDCPAIRARLRHPGEKARGHRLRGILREPASHRASPGGYGTACAIVATVPASRMRKTRCARQRVVLSRNEGQRAKWRPNTLGGIQPRE